MLDYQFFYATWTALFLLIWVVLFLIRKDTRREILIISLAFGFAGLASQKLHLHDWWQPLRITNTPLGLEDFFIGFAIGGVAAVLYEFVVRKQAVHASQRETIRRSSYFFLAFFGFVFTTCFFYFDLNSAYSAITAYIVGIGYMLFKRRDLLINSLVSGTLLLVLGIGIYLLLFLLYPDYIARFWFLPDVWFAKLFLGIPIAEYIWYFLTGAFIGPLYEFVEGLRTRRI